MSCVEDVIVIIKLDCIVEWLFWIWE